jgi:hypothetical protein
MLGRKSIQYHRLYLTLERFLVLYYKYIPSIPGRSPEFSSYGVANSRRLATGPFYLWRLESHENHECHYL